MSEQTAFERAEKLALDTGIREFGYDAAMKAAVRMTWRAACEEIKRQLLDGSDGERFPVLVAEIDKVKGQANHG